MTESPLATLDHPPSARRRCRSLGLPAWIVATVLTTTVLSGCSEETSTAELLESARKHFAAAELNAAAIELKTILSESPDHMDARVLLGRTHLAAFNGPAAEKELERALALGADGTQLEADVLRALILQSKPREALGRRERAAGTVKVTASASTQAPEASTFSRMTPAGQAEVLGLEGHALLSLERLQEALEAYQSALELDSRATEARLGLARLDARAGDLASMRRRLDALIADAPSFAEAQSLLGDLEVSEGKLEQAEAAYSRAMELRPLPLPLDQLKRADVRTMQGKLSDARADLETLAKLKWAHPGVGTGLARLALLEGNAPAALDLARRVIGADADYAPALMVAGVAAFRTGAVEQAESLLSRYVRQAPRAKTAGVMLATLQLRRGEFSAAAASIARLRQAHPDDPAIADLHSVTEMGQGRYQEALALLERSARENSASELAAVKLVVGLEVAGRTGEALEELAAGFERNPESLVAARLYFDRLVRSKQPELALEVARRFRAGRPGDAAAETLVGMGFAAVGDADRAREAFEAAVAIEPKHVEALRGLAFIAERRRDEATAAALRERILEVRPSHLESLLALADVRLRSGEPAKARELLQRAVAEHPKSVAATSALALVERRTGQSEQAVELLNRALAENPDDPRLLLALGEALLDSGQVNQAVTFLKRLVSKLPDSALAHFLLARGAAAAGDAAAAEKGLDDALRINPRLSVALMSRARMHVAKGENPQAAATVERLLEVRPDDAQALDVAVEVAMAGGRYEQALVHAEAAQRAEPTGERAIRLATARARVRDRDGALATLTGWLAEHPTDLRVMASLAEAYEALGDVDSAIATYERIVAVRPDDVFALNNLAWALRSRDPARGVALVEKARKLSNDYPAIVDTHAMLLIEAGEIDRAVALLKDLEQKHPDSPMFQYHLALAHVKGGDKAKARLVLEVLLATFRDFPERGDAQALMDGL
ncbi:MAG: PEP-CTERM system TPR-repeat protein PrsT [Ectothiorhodospiraceae bacterium]|nr:PEP-CTERM system TPR-repeat protein PrsT [Chromatiales bacterium]MCP5154888.1 PEP-CTERM system TPR-repeat protein PrsT [Ectothiorhodospiraceae bacterium]